MRTPVCAEIGHGDGRCIGTTRKCKNCWDEESGARTYLRVYQSSHLTQVQWDAHRRGEVHLGWGLVPKEWTRKDDALIKVNRMINAIE